MAYLLFLLFPTGVNSQELLSKEYTANYQQVVCRAK